MVFFIDLAGDVNGAKHNLRVEFEQRPPLHVVVRAAETLFTALLRTQAVFHDNCDMRPPFAHEGEAASLEKVPRMAVRPRGTALPSSVSPARSSSAADLIMSEPYAHFLVDVLVYFDEEQRQWVELYSAAQLRTGCQIYCFQPVNLVQLSQPSPPRDSGNICGSPDARDPSLGVALRENLGLPDRLPVATCTIVWDTERGQAAAERCVELHQDGRRYFSADDWHQSSIKGAPANMSRHAVAAPHSGSHLREAHDKELVCAAASAACAPTATATPQANPHAQGKLPEKPARQVAPAPASDLRSRIRRVFAALDVERRKYLLLRDFYVFAQLFPVREAEPIALAKPVPHGCSMTNGKMPSKLCMSRLSVEYMRSSHSAAAAANHHGSYQTPQRYVESSEGDGTLTPVCHLGDRRGDAVEDRLLHLCAMTFADVVRYADRDKDDRISYREWVFFCLEHPDVLHVFVAHLDGSQKEGGRSTAAATPLEGALTETHRTVAPPGVHLGDAHHERPAEVHHSIWNSWGSTHLTRSGGPLSHSGGGLSASSLAILTDTSHRSGDGLHRRRCEACREVAAMLPYTTEGDPVCSAAGTMTGTTSRSFLKVVPASNAVDTVDDGHLAEDRHASGVSRFRVSMSSASRLLPYPTAMPADDLRRHLHTIEVYAATKQAAQRSANGAACKR